MIEELKLLEILEVETIEKWPTLFLALNGDTGFFLNKAVAEIASRYFPFKEINEVKYFSTDEIENEFNNKIDKIRRVQNA